jgi:hypothetical protein
LTDPLSGDVLNRLITETAVTAACNAGFANDFAERLPCNIFARLSAFPQLPNDLIIALGGLLALSDLLLKIDLAHVDKAVVTVSIGGKIDL